jgi:predicted peptidase
MRLYFCSILALLLFCATGNAQQKPQDQFQSAQTFHKKISKSLDYQYLLFLPRDYKAKRGERWPLMLFLHGAGERGTNVWRADFHGPSKYIVNHPEFPFVMVTPLCPSNQVWSVEILSNLLDETIKKYRIDTNRVYLTGLSMGGFGTWDMALAMPSRFAAVIPIAGGGNDGAIVLSRLGYCSKEYVQALKSLPFWVFHGGKDAAVDPDESDRMVKSLQRLGVAEVKYTVYPDANHNSWERTYNNPEIYDWLLQHRR